MGGVKIRRKHPGSGGGGGGGGLATFGFNSTGWATFGLALPIAQATGGVKVGSLTTQTDVLRTWGDGSIRHALVTVPIGTPANLQITSDSHAAGSFTPTWPTSTVTLISEGVTYTSSLPAFTSADSYVSGPHLRECKVKTAFTGGSGAASHLHCVWYVRSYSDATHQVTVVVKNGDVEAAGANLVYMTSLVITINGSEVFRRDAVTGTNTLVYETNPADQAGPKITSASHGLTQGDMIELLSGPQTGEHAFILRAIDTNTCHTYYSGPVYAGGVTGFTVDQTNQSWRRVLGLLYGSAFLFRFDVGGFTTATYTPDFTPYYDSYALIVFGTGMANTVYDMSGRDFQVPGVGASQLPFAGATSDEQIGHYPAWVATWQEHKTQNQFDYMLKMADLFPVIYGRFVKADGHIYRHRDSGWENFIIYPNVAPPNGPANLLAGIGGPAGSPYEFDPAHHGSHYYVPYIMTGRREYLDSEKELVAYMAQTYNFNFYPTFSAKHQSQGRGGSSVFLGPGEFAGARGYAWNLRSWSDLASCLPDSDGDQSYFLAVMSDNCGWAEAYAAAVLSDTNNVFGFLGSYTEGYFSSLADVTGSMVAYVYQQAYLAYGIHRCKQHGFMSTSVLRDGLANTMLLKIQADPVYPKDVGIPYFISLGRQSVGRIRLVTPSVAGGATTITMFGAHALTNGDTVTISGSTTTPSIDGNWAITVVNVSDFTISTVTTGAGTAQTGNISNMPCHGGSFTTDNNGVSTVPIQYYTSWAQIYETTKYGVGNSDLLASGEIYSPQQYFLMQCAVQAGLSGASDALAFASTFTPYATFGAFSMARF